MKKAIVLIFTALTILSFSVLLCGCSEGRELIERFKPSAEDVDNLTDMNRTNDGTERLDEYKAYYDEKTGEYVSKRKNSANKASDLFSSTGGLILAWVLFIGGLLLHKIESATTKAWGRGLILLFVLYWIIRYLLAYGADRL